MYVDICSLHWLCGMPELYLTVSWLEWVKVGKIRVRAISVMKGCRNTLGISTVLQRLNASPKQGFNVRQVRILIIKVFLSLFVCFIGRELIGQHRPAAFLLPGLGTGNCESMCSHVCILNAQLFL